MKKKKNQDKSCLQNSPIIHSLLLSSNLLCVLFILITNIKIVAAKHVKQIQSNLQPIFFSDFSTSLRRGPIV